MKIELKIFFLATISFSCVKPGFAVKNHITDERKFYLGRLSTETFQKKISDVFRLNSYGIDEYHNSNTDSKIISKWKINYIEDDDSTSVEYKTRFMIIGLIDNSTYSRNNSFQYECFLEVENYSFMNGSYIQEYNSEFIRNEINIIKDSLANYLISREL